MIQLFTAFIDEVAHRGVKGLAELIAPQLGKAVDFFQGVLEKYRKRKALRDQREEAERIARMTAAQVADDIREYARNAFPDNLKLQQETELYLSLAPGAVRRSLRRADDPTGRSAPADFALSSPEKLAALFPAAVPTLRPGDPVPGREEKYRLVEPIGGGGFGEVWKVADLFRPGHFVALKVFPDPNVKLDVIRHELTQARRLNHPEKGWPAGVVPVVDSRLDTDRPWIMYEFVGGGTLADLIVQWQALVIEERVKRTVVAVREMAATCGHFHGLRPALVHRDLKPANVLRTADGGALKITDLGLGGAAVEYELATESQGYRSVTGRLPSQLYGSYSLNYASPQQRKGEAPDPRDDVHALGVIAYQMLTGRLDAAPGTDTAEELKDLKVPSPVVNLVKACTASNPDRRPKNGAEVVEIIVKFTTPKAAIPLPPVPVGTPVATPVVKPLIGKRVRPKPEPLPELEPNVELAAEPEPEWEAKPVPSHGNKVAVVLALLLLAAALGAAIYFGAADGAATTKKSSGKVSMNDDRGAQNEYDRGVAAYDGAGVTRDLPAARALFEQAAKRGHASAQRSLGFMLLEGQGGPKDVAAGIEWTRKAADQGDRGAIRNLGWCYMAGEGVTKNPAQAVTLSEQARALGDTKAAANLANWYENGTGVAVDSAKAVGLHRQAAEGGVAESQHRMGWLHEQGAGVTRDYAAARDWYAKAADQGLGVSMCGLANVYSQGGFGLTQDCAAARTWYRKAIEKDVPEACYGLALLLRNGLGGPFDYVEAGALARRAAAAKVTGAQALADELAALKVPGVK